MRVAILWTGGKDSCWVLQHMIAAGNEIPFLVTFAPRNADFLAHPIPVMEAQAEATGIPWLKIRISEPFREGYERGLMVLKRDHGIEAVVTGDISEVDGLPNWIRECSQVAGLQVITPLWGVDRLEQMQRLIKEDYDVLFSCVKHRWFTPEWTGRRLNEASLTELRGLHAQNGVDLCGEQGEFHTLVTRAPCFNREIQLLGTTIESKVEFSFLRMEACRLSEVYQQKSLR